MHSAIITYTAGTDTQEVRVKFRSAAKSAAGLERAAIAAARGCNAGLCGWTRTSVVVTY